MSEIRRRGLMLVLSSPSGAGKTTLSRRLLDADSGIVMSVSATTRPKRSTEVEGRDYCFVRSEAFDAMVCGNEFLEYATVFNHQYGTPKAPVMAALAHGRDVLFDIDWQGTQQLKERVREDLVSVFVLPPSHAELER
ncbi:MAG TPA: guanylate kinase, partial [Rhizomicrobium sp.]